MKKPDWYTEKPVFKAPFKYRRFTLDLKQVIEDAKKEEELRELKASSALSKRAE